MDEIIRNRRVIFFVWMILMTCYGMWMLFGKWLLVGIAIYAVYYIATHAKELQRTRVQDYINPLKWGSVLFATFMKFMFPVHIVEQLILRMFDMECRQCVKDGACVHCGCDISKVFVPWDRCTNGNWGPMIEDAEKYREIREAFPVEITVRYTKEANKLFTIPADAQPGDIYEVLSGGECKKINKPTQGKWV